MDGGFDLPPRNQLTKQGGISHSAPHPRFPRQVSPAQEKQEICLPSAWCHISWIEWGDIISAERICGDLRLAEPVPFDGSHSSVGSAASSRAARVSISPPKGRSAVR